MGFIDELLVRVGLTGDREFKRQMRSVRQDTQRETKKMGGAFKGVAAAVRTFIGGVVVQQIGKAVLSVANLAEQQRVLETSSKRLASGIGQNYKQIEQAITRGMNGAISRIDALKFSNQAILLGLPVTAGAMEELSRTALRLGRAMNLGPTESMESMVVGIGRQSKLWLDNLGIIVDTEAAYKKAAEALDTTVEALDDNQKKIAFFNATMDQARKMSQQLGDVAPSLTENMAKLRSNWENLAATVGAVLVPQLNNLVEVFNRLANVTTSKGTQLSPIERLEAHLMSDAELRERQSLGVRRNRFGTELMGRAINRSNMARFRKRMMGEFRADLGPQPFAKHAPGSLPTSAASSVMGALPHRRTFSAATGQFGEVIDVPMIKEKAEKAAEVAFVEFESIPDKMGDSFESNLMKMEAQMQAFGLKGRGIFGGMANMRAGFSSLGFGGENKTLKALSDVAGKIAGVGQVIGGVIGIGKALFGGPSLQERLESESDAELRERIRIGRKLGNTAFYKAGNVGDLAERELEKRRTQGSQTIGGTVTTLTDATGKMMLAETASMNSAVQKYLPYLETMDANLRVLASGGVSADSLTRNRGAAGVG